jgi:D-alanine-D-alanine ligase
MNIAHWLKKNRIGVLFGGRSAEREISIASGKAVLAALKKAGAHAVGIDAKENLPQQLLKQKIDFAYIALHGPMGEDGTVQGLLEVMGIPYAGCGVLSSALSMNKVFTKRILDAAGLPTPRWGLANKGNIRYTISRFPVVVKPATQGSAIGVSIVRKKQDLPKALSDAFALDTTVLLEEYIAGTEITAGVLGDQPLPVIEIVPSSSFYDFTSKYTPGRSQHLIPPRLPNKTIRRIQQLALDTFRALDCRAMARIDMIVDKKQQPWILEANTIPGMTETSLFPDAAAAAGLDFTALVLKIIECSLPMPESSGKYKK